MHNLQYVEVQRLIKLLVYILICNSRDGEYNGVAAWMVYDLDDVTSVSFGPVGEIFPGDYIAWNMERKQGM